MAKKDLPKICYVAETEFDNICKDEDNVLKLLVSSGAYAVIIKDDYVKAFVASNNLSDRYPDNSILVFKNDKLTDEQVLSILCHELMHYFFKGIDNQSDEGNGYNEACTDYLGAFFFGEKYFTGYSNLNENDASYMKYYYNFWFRFSDEEKLKKLSEYFSINN